MTAVDLLLVRVKFRKAVYAVACAAHCKAAAGDQCHSTGGGNPQLVPPHARRWLRLAGWDVAKLSAAQDLVLAQGRKPWWHMPDGYYTQTEGWASPITEARRAFTAKGVRLSETQAEEIERAAANVGVLHVSTAHFHGDAAHRQTVNSLEAKGILRHVGNTSDGYDRRMELTSFGWQVYRQHRLILHRFLADDVAAELELAARNAEMQAAQVAQVAEVAAEVADVPGAVPPKVERIPARPQAPARKPLPPFRTGGTVVSLAAARARKRNALAVPGGIA